jgi:hypothetical protein
MSFLVGTEADTGATESLEMMNAVAVAGDEIDDVNMFAKLIKKAEEAAQAAV